MKERKIFWNTRTLRLLVVLFLPIAAEVHASRYYYHDFDSEGLTYSHHDMGWDSPVGPVPTQPVICDQTAASPPGLPCESNSPNKSLRFNFPSGSISQSNQHMYLPSNMKEVWLEWYQYFPDTWEHINLTTDDTTQFFRIATPSVSIESKFIFDMSGNEIIDVDTAVDGSIVGLLLDENGHKKGPGIFPTKRGSWLRMRWHVKTASDSTTDNGIVNFWINEDKILNNTDVALYSTSTTAGSNSFTTVRLMGAADSGFISDSHTYIDDVFISNRPPVSIALVLDRSGSMNRPTRPGGPIKIDALKRAANIFVDTLPPYANPRDKIGVVTFNQEATTLSPLVNINVASIDSIKNNIITPLVAERSTSVGDGLLKARDEVFNGDSNLHRTILLFTDGKQNTAPEVDVGTLGDFTTAAGITIEGDPFDPLGTTMPLEPLGGLPFHPDNHIEICVISVGISDAVRREFNSGISHCRDRNGNPLDTLDVDTLCDPADPLCEYPENMGILVEDFLTVLENAVIGDRLEKAKVIHGSFGSGKKKTEQFVVSEKDVRLTVILLWSNPKIESLDVKLRSPSPQNIEIDPAPFTKSGKRYKVISFPLPGINRKQVIPHKGVWELVINPSKNKIPASHYDAIFMLDNKTIKADYSFRGSDFGTGENIPLQVRLRETGKPILGAKVVAQIFSPDDGVGNVLANNSSPPLKRDVAVSKDPLSPLEQKLNQLLEREDIRKQLVRSARASIVLKDDDGDGTYTGQYTNTLREGIYNFRFQVECGITEQEECATPEKQEFTRTQLLNLHVRTKPSPSTTKARVDVIDRGQKNSGVVRLTVIPFDALGNYLGPGYAPFMKVSTTQGKLVGKVTDTPTLDGSYVQTIALDNLSQNPIITVTLRDRVIVNALKSDLEPIPLWLIILIILLLLIGLSLLIWLLVKSGLTPLWLSVLAILLLVIGLSLLVWLLLQ